MIGVLLIISIAGHYGNKHTMRLGMLIGLAGQLVIAGGVYLRQLWLLFFGILVNSIGQGMIVGLVSIMLADTIRYGITLGAQAEGFFASSNDFGVNLGLGIGGLVTAGLFDLTGYVPNTSQNAATLGMIDLNYVWLPLLLYGILLLLIHFYPEKKMLTAIREHHL
ncbi:putative transporter protein [Lacticaseibacillus casei DSM 20011 = JCM 1134 = ATCC 393]|uniref:Transporter protein n=1 Tax=Lacticaseibacillus casei DSM 20011 = JCM 1134 = ATCC 393 TaxID=1423732 RepID=A0AAD1AMD1_LACCA|nr:putative transporter protein [Lacticaseibacillus casei DSM 20011 = JCM 1134 = ATCC 393]